MEDGRSKLFDVNDKLHQESDLTLLLFAMVLDKTTKDVREGILKEFLYVNDLLLPGGSWSGVEERYGK